MKIVLYTIDCPKCRILERELDKKEIHYTTVKDRTTMLNLGFVSAPMLAVDDKILTFAQAIKWVSEVN